MCSIDAGVPQKVNDSIDDIPNFSENAVYFRSNCFIIYFNDLQSCNNLKTTSDSSSTDTCPCEVTCPFFLNFEYANIFKTIHASLVY